MLCIFFCVTAKRKEIKERRMCLFVVGIIVIPVNVVVHRYRSQTELKIK